MTSTWVLLIDNLNVVRKIFLFKEMFVSCVYNLASNFNFLNTVDLWSTYILCKCTSLQ